MYLIKLLLTGSTHSNTYLLALAAWWKKRCKTVGYRLFGRGVDRLTINLWKLYLLHLQDFCEQTISASWWCNVERKSCFLKVRWKVMATLYNCDANSARVYIKQQRRGGKQTDRDRGQEASWLPLRSRRRLSVQSVPPAATMKFLAWISVLLSVVMVLALGTVPGTAAGEYSSKY